MRILVGIFTIGVIMLVVGIALAISAFMVPDVRGLILGGMLGGIIAFLGFIVIIGAGVAALFSETEAPARPMRTCLGCGAQISMDYVVCPHCGKKVEKT